MPKPYQRTADISPLSDDERYAQLIKNCGIDTPSKPEKNITFNPLNLFNDELLPVLPVPYEALPAQILPWAKDVSSRLGCSADYLIAGTLTGLSSLLGRKILVKPKQKDTWLVTPNLWGGMVGRPSTKKTPSEKAALSYVEKLDRDYRAENSEAYKQYNAELQYAKIMLDENKKKVKKLDKEAALKLIVDAENIPKPPTKRAVVHNSTVEKLIMLLADNPNGLIEIRDEISGFLKTLDRDEFAESREFYLMAFNGDVSYSHDRVSRDAVYLPHCILSVFGGIQPSKIKPYLVSMKNGKSDDGLLQRFQMLVYPDPVIEVGADEYPLQEPQTQINAIFDRFNALPEPTEDSPPQVLSFTPDAQTIFNEWQTECLNKARKETSLAMESHLSKYPAFVASLALIIHIAENTELSPISRNSILKAVGLSEYFESHARRIYGLVDTPDYSARSLADNLHKLKSPFKLGDFKNKDWSGLTTSTDRKQALETLVKRGYLSEEKQPVKNHARTTSIYHINPKFEEV